ncbi:hypothetical protein JCM18903_2752 [Psychrobacter sp. JCM 18903]|nr:hypothetical protein JCM18903_2752 [Psychrobacter sp. JCM 18903]
MKSLFFYPYLYHYGKSHCPKTQLANPEYPFTVFQPQKTVFIFIKNDIYQYKIAFFIVFTLKVI